MLSLIRLFKCLISIYCKHYMGRDKMFTVYVYRQQLSLAKIRRPALPGV